MFEKLIDVSQCPPATGIFVQHDAKELAVFHLADPDRFVVSENACPHASGNLSAGEIIGDCVTCPVHNWTFDLNSGHCIGTTNVFVKRYACRIQGTTLQADLTKHLPVPPPQQYDF